jgi:hypothetical protein
MFYRMPPLELIWCFSQYFTEVKGCRRKITEVKGCFHHIKSAFYHHDLWLFMLTLITCLRYCLTYFSTVKVLFPPFLSYIVWKKVAKLCPHLRSYAPHTWAQRTYVNYLGSLCIFLIGKIHARHHKQWCGLCEAASWTHPPLSSPRPWGSLTWSRELGSYQYLHYVTLPPWFRWPRSGK